MITTKELQRGAPAAINMESTSRVKNYTLNEKTAIKKKIKACKGPPLKITMEKGNNLRIICSAAMFEATRRMIEEIVTENESMSIIQCEDRKGKVVSNIIRVTDKEVRGNRPIFTINVYRTTTSFLVNGTQVQKFIQKVIPMIQSWAQYNQTAIEVMDKTIEKLLGELKTQYVGGADGNHGSVTGGNGAEDIIEEENHRLDFKVENMESKEYVLIESDIESNTQQKQEEEKCQNLNDGQRQKEVKDKGETEIKVNTEGEQESENEKDIKEKKENQREEEHHIKKVIEIKEDKKEMEESWLKQNTKETIDDQNTRREGKMRFKMGSEQKEEEDKNNKKVANRSNQEKDGNKTPSPEHGPSKEQLQQEDTQTKNKDQTNSIGETKSKDKHQGMEEIESNSRDNGLKTSKPIAPIVEELIYPREKEKSGETSREDQETKRKDIEVEKGINDNNAGKTVQQSDNRDNNGIIMEIKMGQQKEENSICKTCKKYVGTGVYCGKCGRWYHFDCEDTTKKEIKKKFPGETQYSCKYHQQKETKELITKSEGQQQENERNNELEKMREENERIKRENVELEKKYRELRDQHKLLEKTAEQTNSNLMRVTTEKKTAEEVIKTLRALTKTRIGSAPDKEEQLNQMKIRNEKDKEMIEEMRKEINKKVEELRKIMEEQNEETKKNQSMKTEITRLQQENQRLIKMKEKELQKSTIEKEKSANIIKKLEEEKKDWEKKNTRMKEVNIELESQLMNNDKTNTKSNNSREAVSNGSEERQSGIIIADEERQSKIQEAEKCHACDSKHHKIKDCTKGNNIFVTYKKDKCRTEQELRNIMGKYGRVKIMKLKKEEVRGYKNAMVCFKTKTEAETAFTGLRKCHWRAEIYNHSSKSGREDWKTRDQYNTKIKCYACEGEGHKIKDCNKKVNIWVQYQEYMTEREIRQIMEEYGAVKKVKIRETRGYDQQALVCFTQESEAEREVREINEYYGWKAEEYNNVNKDSYSGKSYGYDKQQKDRQIKETSNKKLEEEIHQMNSRLQEIMGMLRGEKQ